MFLFWFEFLLQPLPQREEETEETEENEENEEEIFYTIGFCKSGDPTFL